MNRLGSEASPYLREHADNPVDWYPWGEEALARSRAGDKPIFLSIGYAACHWCHVMARESFSDPAIAAFLNEHFVAIKVDREERPDLDELYVEAVRLIAGTAGWPLSVFLTPELKPFYGGTYFPPEPRGSLPAFRRVLESVLHHYRAERHEIAAAANRVTAELVRLSSPPLHRGGLGLSPLDDYYRHKLETFDSDHGGFGIAPKFPSPLDLLLLLKLARRPGFGQALPMVELTIRRMADGGIHDQLGGGFHRYSTDTIWLVPHFEKMLYDNALLAQVYARHWLETGDEASRSVAEQTLGWLERDMLLPGGGFASALDADSEGGEGRHYLWTAAEVGSALGPELGRLACDFYGVSEPGHFEGGNVLHVSAPVEYLLREHRLDLDRLWNRLADVRRRLLATRDQRPPARRDDKVLADWNGLALSAFSICARLFRDPHLLELARGLGAFLQRELRDGPDVIHFRRPSQTDVAGQLPDYALVGQGLLDLFDATGEPQHLAAALTIADRMAELFSDPEGGFFTTRPDSDSGPARIRNGYDGAIPSGNSVAAGLLLRLARITDRNDLERLAAATVRRFYGTMVTVPAAFPLMLANLDLLLRPGPDVVLFLPGPSAEGDRMQELLARADNAAVVIVPTAQPDPLSTSLIPMLRHRGAISGRPTAWVCIDHTCHEPVTEAAELERLLAAVR